MFKFFGVQRASAMEVNAHVHLQSTVILRMASFHQHCFFFEPVQHYYQLPVFYSRTVFLNKVIFRDRFISQSANFDSGNFTGYWCYSSEFKGNHFWPGCIGRERKLGCLEGFLVAMSRAPQDVASSLRHSFYGYWSL